MTGYSFTKRDAFTPNVGKKADLGLLSRRRKRGANSGSEMGGTWEGNLGRITLLPITPCH